jgi:hypothetical protein
MMTSVAKSQPRKLAGKPPAPPSGGRLPAGQALGPKPSAPMIYIAEKGPNALPTFKR